MDYYRNDDSLYRTEIFQHYLKRIMGLRKSSSPLVNNMTKLFFSCHGYMASGMKKSLDILTGDTSKLDVFDAYVNEDNLEDVVQNFLDKTDDEDMVILLSDMYGGSVNQVLYQFAAQKNIPLITGVNLPLLLELLTAANFDSLNQGRIEQIVDSAKETIMIVDTKQKNVDENFF